jgi:hypothetical protein
MASSKRNEIRAAMQQRVKRFSAFELLGLDGDQSSISPVEKEQLSSSPEISTESSESPDTTPKSDISDGLMYPQTIPSEVTSGGLRYPQTVPSAVPSDLDISDHMIQVRSDSTSLKVDLQKKELLPPIGTAQLAKSVPLAPLQWRVWQMLLDSEGRVVSYHWLASQVKGSIPGIRQAIRIIEREGGILSRPIIREKTQEGAVLQGFRVVLNQGMTFHPISAHEAHKLLQRKIGNHDISKGKIQPPSDISDGLRMYVSKRIQTYMSDLLRLCPPGWQIREQTLVKIAETFPEMSPLEFRRSIRYMVEQSKISKQAIQNPNAWLKAAFERNGGPLITERMIEAQIDQRSPTFNTGRNMPTVETDSDLEILRRYVSASMEDKVAIDRLAFLKQWL